MSDHTTELEAMVNLVSAVHNLMSTRLRQIATTDIPAGGFAPVLLYVDELCPNPNHLELQADPRVELLYADVLRMGRAAKVHLWFPGGEAA